MEEIKVNDYIRTVDGIKKVVAINTGTRVTIYGKYVLDKDYKGIRPAIAEKNILKHSPNITDLIEVGDYVNGRKVTSVYDENKEDELIQLEFNSCGNYVYLTNDDVKNIVTHEQFYFIKYEVK